MASLLDIWRLSSSRLVCRYHDCYECREILKVNDCPEQIELTKEEVAKFVSAVTDKLIDKEDNHIAVTEDEFISILEDAFY